MNNTKLANLINLYGGNNVIKINNLENMVEHDLNDSNTSEYAVDLLEIFDTSSEYEGGKGKGPKVKAKAKSPKSTKSPKSPKSPKATKSPKSPQSPKSPKATKSPKSPKSPKQKPQSPKQKPKVDVEDAEDLLENENLDTGFQSKQTTQTIKPKTRNTQKIIDTESDFELPTQSRSQPVQNIQPTQSSIFANLSKLNNLAEQSTNVSTDKLINTESEVPVGNLSKLSNIAKISEPVVLNPSLIPTQNISLVPTQSSTQTNNLTQPSTGQNILTQAANLLAQTQTQGSVPRQIASTPTPTQYTVPITQPIQYNQSTQPTQSYQNFQMAPQPQPYLMPQFPYQMPPQPFMMPQYPYQMQPQYPYQMFPTMPPQNWQPQPQQQTTQPKPISMQGGGDINKKLDEINEELSKLL